MRMLATVMLIALASCGQKAVVTEPAKPTNYIFAPDVADTDRVCIVIPSEPPYTAEMVGVHCITVHDLRWLLGRSLKAN